MVSDGGTVGDMVLFKEGVHNSITKICPPVTYHCTRHSEPDKDMGFDEVNNSFGVLCSDGFRFYPLGDIVHCK